MQVPSRLRAWLSSPRADRVVLALIALLSLLAVDTGLGADDHIHALILRGSRELPSLERSPLDLFAFVTGEPAHNARMMRDGVLPWWTDLEARISFFRPLSSATHWLDYQLWPDHPWLMHVQSLLWFWAGVLGIRALYLRLTSARWIALLALLMYGIDDARGAPITWIANRHALVSCTFAVWALVAHVRWREEKSALAMVAAPVLFALGLLGGESAVGMAGYFVAYALIDPAPTWTRRLAALVPSRSRLSRPRR